MVSSSNIITNLKLVNIIGGRSSSTNDNKKRNRITIVIVLINITLTTTNQSIYSDIS